jgi:predicted transposase/invertase (TIGR01784 family)
MTASDKLFYWLFQNHPDRILELQRDLPPEASGWRFSAPVVKEREHRLDGLFQPPASQPELPVVLLEAQMAADGKFLRRLYAQSARLVEQEVEIEHWRVVVICPHRHLNFGSPVAVEEFVRERVHWVELLPAAKDLSAPPLLRALALLVQAEEEIPASSAAIQAEVAGTGQEEAIADVIAAIVVTRFNGRSIPELCAMGGITLEEFTQSVAYREIFGQGRQEGREEGREEGRQEGRQEGELELALRLLRRRCGELPSQQVARIRALPLERLEALAEALLDFQNLQDLDAWLGTAA